MKPAPFDYVAPKSLTEAIALLADNTGGATILAGGQTLMPLLALRMSQPFVLVDINRVAGLDGVTHANGGVRIGATTRQNALIADESLLSALPTLVMATRHVGHYQTRNRGTIGGSVCLGEPAAELPATCVALGAIIEAHSRRGVRKIRADEFYLGPYSTALHPDEMVVAITLPDWTACVPLFREVTRRPGDFALVGFTGALAVEDGVIQRAGLAWFGMGPTPMKARRAESALVGQQLARLNAADIAELAIADTDPFSDAHASAEYRRVVGKRVLTRALGDASLRAAA